MPVLSFIIQTFRIIALLQGEKVMVTDDRLPTGTSTAIKTFEFNPVKDGQHRQLPFENTEKSPDLKFVVVLADHCSQHIS